VKPNSPRATSRARRSGPGRKATAGIVHPVIIYPFHHPDHYAGLVELYELVARLDADRVKYARPITVLDRKTHRVATAADRKFARFRDQTIARHSDLLQTWGVDTCQMWYSGLGHAFDHGGPDDVYWLIPGDFNYGTRTGNEVLMRLHDLPEIIMDLDQDICIGEIATDHCNSKQLIDTYGTFALLYTWFPAEAQEIRQFTERPRSEFLALRHGFLGEALRQRWYPYEQTVVLLLQAVFGRKGISRFSVGHISDLPEGRESLASAMLQVERTERVLKAVWREHHQTDPDWIERYRQLAVTSNKVRHTALTILHNLLA